MNDETRKALDKIFAPNSDKIKPMGASYFHPAEENYAAHYLGAFEVGGVVLNKLRQLYDDAIAADDAEKLDAQREADANAENDKIKKDNAGRIAAAEAAFEAAKASVFEAKKDKGVG